MVKIWLKGSKFERKLRPFFELLFWDYKLSENKDGYYFIGPSWDKNFFIDKCKQVWGEDNLQMRVKILDTRKSA